MLVPLAAFSGSLAGEGQVLKVDGRALIESDQVVLDLPGLAPVPRHKEDAVHGHHVPA